MSNESHVDPTKPKVLSFLFHFRSIFTSSPAPAHCICSHLSSCTFPCPCCGILIFLHLQGTLYLLWPPVLFPSHCFLSNLVLFPAPLSVLQGALPSRPGISLLVARTTSRAKLFIASEQHESHTIQAGRTSVFIVIGLIYSIYSHVWTWSQRTSASWL